MSAYLGFDRLRARAAADAADCGHGRLLTRPTAGAGCWALGYKMAVVSRPDEAASRQPRPKRNFRGLVLGAMAVVAAVGVGWVTIWLASQGSVESNLGDDEQRLGDHRRLSERIDQGPILFPSSEDGSRYFYLQHLGEDPLRGWSAFDASWPGSDCSYVWNGQVDWFEPPDDPQCAGLGIVEADGGGLRQYVVRVDAEGQVVVRFGSAGAG